MEMHYNSAGISATCWALEPAPHGWLCQAAMPPGAHSQSRAFHTKIDQFLVYLFPLSLSTTALIPHMNVALAICGPDPKWCSHFHVPDRDCRSPCSPAGNCGDRQKILHGKTLFFTYIYWCKVIISIKCTALLT